VAGRRTEDEITHAWVTLLEMLHICPTGATTKKLAGYVDQPPAQTRRDLNSLKKRGLVKSRKEAGKLLWYISSPQGNQAGLWGQDRFPDRSRLQRVVNKARKRKGVDARSWNVVKLGKKAYAKQVPGALVDWSRADEIIKNWRGSPKNLRLKLAGGCGSTAIWDCGCSITVSWKGDKTIKSCRLPICYRLLAQGKEQTKPAPRSNRNKVKNVAWSDEPIDKNQCWLTFTAPRGKRIGNLYRLTCGCIACVSEVTNTSGSPDRILGVIGPDRGKVVCHKHKTQQRVYNRAI